MMVKKNVPDYSQYEAGSKERIAGEKMADFEAGLRNMLWIEKALLRFIPKMMESATSAKLKESMDAHHKQIKGHVIKLESVFKYFRLHPESLKDTAIETVLTESEQEMKNNRHSMQDQKMIDTLLQLKKHEQQAYKLLSVQAEALNMNDAAKLLLEMHADETNYAEELSNMPLDER